MAYVSYKAIEMTFISQFSIDLSMKFMERVECKSQKSL